MSHEDIQRTLQANMPLPAAAAAAAAAQSKAHNGHLQPQQHQQPHPAIAAHAHHPHPVDLNPMDFIEHDVVAPPPPPTTASTTAPPTGSNFDMNLDAFDVFGDFSDLQENNGAGHYGQQHQQQPHLNKIKRGDAEHLAQITEYSPDWAWSDVSEPPTDRLDSETFKKAMGTEAPFLEGSVETESIFTAIFPTLSSIIFTHCCFDKSLPSPWRRFAVFYIIHLFPPQVRFTKVPFVSLSLSPPSPRFSLVSVSRIALYIAYSNSILYTLKRSLRSLPLSFYFSLSRICDAYIT